MGSGSSGNAILLEGDRSLLLEAGFPHKVLLERIARAGANAQRIDGIVVSHEHGDHSRGAARLAEELGVPVIATRGTLDALDLGEAESEAIEYGSQLDVGGWNVGLFAVDHDAAQPAGLLVQRAGTRLGYLTDVGRASAENTETLRGCHHLLVESNHDTDLLRNGPYSTRLKRRIQGTHGHLSNDACGAFLQSVITAQTRRVVLHHLSRSNNTPQLALATNHAILHRTGQVPPAMVAAPAHGPFGPFGY